MSNDKRPGLPNYVGPTAGPFACVHHDILWEMSHNIMERVAVITIEKPKREVATRLHNLLYLGAIAELLEERDAVDAKWRSERDAVNAKWRSEWDAVDAKWRPEWGAVDAKWRSEWDAVDAKWRSEWDAVNAKILAYIKSEIPDCAWNGKELVFPG